MQAPGERRGGGVEVLCPCLELTAKDVHAWAAATRANAEEVCHRSGAASACGSCVQSVVDIAGDPGGLPAIGAGWPAEAYALPSAEQFVEECVARASTRTLSLLLGGE